MYLCSAALFQRPSSSGKSGHAPNDERKRLYRRVLLQFKSDKTRAMAQTRTVQRPATTQ